LSFFLLWFFGVYLFFEIFLGIINGMKLIRKITSSGKYSKVIVIPREFLRALSWRQNQNLELELDEVGKRIIVKDSKGK